MVVAAALILLALVVFANRGRIHFDWAMFFAQLGHVSWARIAAGIALIYSTYWFRALRWSVFLAPATKVRSSVLVGPQFIGFTAVALFGRLADLTRPYLVARRIQLPVSSQVAVYTVERMFDLGSAAIVFSSALALAPAGLPHRENYVRVGALSMAATLGIALFAVFVRVAGARVAELAEHGLGRISKGLAHGVAEKILGFREGLNAIASVQEFFVALGISLAMWGMIGEAYVQVAHAFVHTPELAGLSYARTMLLFAASLGGSLVQLPVIGWFTQIAVMAASMREFYGAPVEAATACGALMLIVMTLSIVPAGLVFARLESVSVSRLAEESAS